MSNLAPLALLRRGIETRCWSDARDAYVALTGAEVSVAPEPAQDTSAEQLAARIRDLLDGFFEAEPEEVPEVPEPAAQKVREEPAAVVVRPRSPDGTGKPARGETATAAAHVNQFKDDTTQGRDLAELDQKIVRKERPEPRPPHRKVAVTCERCGKKEEVHPTLAPRRLDRGDKLTAYLCNSCQCGGSR